MSESCKNREALKKEVLDIVKENAMLPYYEKWLCPSPLNADDLVGAPDEALKAQLKKANEEELAKIEAKIEDATQNLGDMEVRDALLEKAHFFNRIGDKEAALEAYKVTFEKTVGVGGKLDNILTCIRVAFFFDDKELVKKEIERAKLELAKGGDWERRNKLKVYEGMYLMTTREWKQSATLFLNVMPTFTATEMVEFKDFVFYAVVMSMTSLDRKTIREQLISSPEVLSVIKETPCLQEFMESYFNSQYQVFTKNFVPIIDSLTKDRYLKPHVRRFNRIMRLNAYRQFLASYRSVTLEAMASEFGVSPAFIDSELASFISSGKLSCKIDKVGGVIESNEKDNRSSMYVEIIKQGDLLLNRMQKLSGAIDM
jgi:26S proteasome regulatory subunit N7